MKQLLKICYLIIFATIVASVSTSCSNDSELFEEPVMYQTRAMTRANMGGEPYKLYESGYISSEKIELIENSVYATITLNWGPHGVTNIAAWSFLDAEYIDKSYYYVVHNFSPVPTVDINNMEVRVGYTISSVWQKVDGQNGEDSIIKHPIMKHIELTGQINELKNGRSTPFYLNSIDYNNIDTLIIHKL